MGKDLLTSILSRFSCKKTLRDSFHGELPPSLRALDVEKLVTKDKKAGPRVYIKSTPRFTSSGPAKLQYKNIKEKSYPVTYSSNGISTRSIKLVMSGFQQLTISSGF